MNEREETRACDLIERQAARLAKCPFDVVNDYTRGWNDACDAIADNAPPAQPELANNSPKVDRGFGDLIERQAAIDVAKQHWYKPDIAKSLEELPSAQPEIIRCKDCKYRDENQRKVTLTWLPCMDVRTGGNWYCGSAERRKDG